MQSTNAWPEGWRRYVRLVATRAFRAFADPLEAWKALAIELERRHPGDIHRLDDLGRLGKYSNPFRERGEPLIVEYGAVRQLVPFSIRVVTLVAERHVRSVGADRIA